RPSKLNCASARRVGLQGLPSGHVDADDFERSAFLSNFVEPPLTGICLTILKAKSMRYGQTLLVSPWKAPNFFCPLPEDRWMYVKIMVMGTPFYVNRGVLAIYGSEEYLGTENPEELVAIATNEFIESCKQATVGEVVMSLFTWLHPLTPPISSRLLRAALLFARQHKMSESSIGRDGAFSCSGWGLLTHMLTKKQASKHYLRIVDMAVDHQLRRACAQTFQSINLQSIFGPRHEMHDLAEQELHIEQQQEVTVEGKDSVKI
ncbi:unnamed protein product, partial [Mesorhabditis belari]